LVSIAIMQFLSADAGSLDKICCTGVSLWI
jgi:hypothetical protein